MLNKKLFEENIHGIIAFLCGLMSFIFSILFVNDVFSLPSDFTVFFFIIILPFVSIVSFIKQLKTGKGLIKLALIGVILGLFGFSALFFFFALGIEDLDEDHKCKPALT
ncbi:MAG: hypothetical protein QW331_03740 [Candidatus Woesearchaeota archaeon]